MSKKNCRTRSAFSLVELVVVVLILGIIAAVAAPRMFDSAGDARQNSTRTSLVVLRDAIELYKAQNGVYPPAATLPTVLRAFIKGPFPAVHVGVNKNADVAVVTTDPISTPTAGGAGWAYNETTGSLVVNDALYIAW